MGNLFIADGPRIRKVNREGVITSLTNVSAGNVCPDFSDEYGGVYSEYVSIALAADTAGNLFIADSANNRVRKLTPGGVLSLVAGNGAYGFSGDGIPAASSPLYCPSSVAVDSEGNVFISEFKNNRVLKVTPDGILRILPTNATSGPLAVDRDGNLFITDSNHHSVLKLTPSGAVSIVAGNGQAGFDGDGGPATAARLNYPQGVAVDETGVLFIADTNNHRIRRVGVVSSTPTLTRVFPDVGVQGVKFTVTLEGTGFVGPLILDVGNDIAVSDLHIVTDVLATATLTVSSNATLGARSLTLTTSQGPAGSLPFTIATPFPDASIISSHVGNLGVGSNGVYTVVIVNRGQVATSDALTVTDILPAGLAFVSGTGTGWTCSALAQTVTCVNSQSLAVGGSTSLALTVAVGADTAPYVVHSPTVTTRGDLMLSNNAASDPTIVATLTLSLQFDSALNPGVQTKLGLTLPAAFPTDVTGVLRVGFASNAVIEADDPAIQFATGGREVSFTIPANTTEARFVSNAQVGVGFQPGTVAGTLTFNGSIHSGSAGAEFSTTRTIARQPPLFRTVRTSTGGEFAAFITVISTTREISRLTIFFNTTPPVKPSCGEIVNCTVSGNTLGFDVKPLFDAWFTEHPAMGGISTLRLPLAIQGAVRGTVGVTLRNSAGTPAPTYFLLP